MTVFQMLEKVQKQFPQIGFTEFLIDLNSVYKTFCHETRILKKYESYTPIANTISFILSDEFPDIDGNLVYRIDCLSAGEFVSTSSSLQYNIDTGVITFFDYTGEQITTIADIDEIKFYYVAIPDDLINNTDEPEIDSQFHQALLYALLEQYYATYTVTTGITKDGTQLIGKDLQSANYYAGKYKQLELVAKRKANE